MSARGQFFIIFVITCMVISFLFYLLFRNKSKPLLPYSYFSKMPLGLPGMNKKPVKKSKPTKSSIKNKTNLGKPLPPPKLPVPPKPLVVKVAPPGPPLRKPMMT